MKIVGLLVSATLLLTTNAWANDPIRRLPAELSPVLMFQQADIVVQTIMLGLAAAAGLAWIVVLAKNIEIILAERRLRQLVRGLTQNSGLSDALATSMPNDNVGRTLLTAAADEITQSHDMATPAGLQDRIQLRVARIEAGLVRRIAAGIGLLATIGSVAPFVGLFGTVWGIMNSFIGISRVQSTSLAVVAPGIAEALLATAIGLAAAIPAVVFHNHLVRRIGAYRALIGDATALVLVLTTRDLDRRSTKEA